MTVKAAKRGDEGSATGFWARFMVLAVVVLWASLAGGSWAGRYLLEHNKKFAIKTEEYKPFADQRSRLQGRPPVLPQLAPPKDTTATPEAKKTPDDTSGKPAEKESPLGDTENPDLKVDTTAAIKTKPEPAPVAPKPVEERPAEVVVPTPASTPEGPAAPVEERAQGGERAADPENAPSRPAPAPPVPTPEQPSQPPASGPPVPTPTGNGL
ncbi:MAG: hypothetical protein FJX76_03365 [Armatimonadetes bacterium]|nr:hypothetical protein [Armatimonadota bacterium]